jgi:hypothetical protein
LELGQTFYCKIFDEFFVNCKLLIFRLYLGPLYLKAEFGGGAKNLILKIH